MSTKNFIVRVRGPHGERQTRFVKASDSREVTERLRADGFSEIEFLTDDTTSTQGDAIRELSPHLVLELGKASPLRIYLLISYAIFKKLWYLYAVLLIFLGIDWYQSQLVTPLNVCTFLIVLSPFFLPLVFPNSRRFAKLQDARVRADWPAVLHLCSKFERSARKLPNLRLEAAYYRSHALLALDRREEAFEELNALRSDPEISLADVKCRLAMLHMVERNRDATRSELEEAIALEPNHAGRMITFAEVSATFLRDPQTARYWLERARTMAMSRDMADLIPGIEAQIALCEERYEDARPGLEGLMELLRQREKAHPIARALRHDVEAALAIACARTGRMGEAARLYESCHAHLIAHKQGEMLERVGAAMRGESVSAPA